MALRERAERKIEYEPNTGCWLWVAGLDRDGYGKFWVNGATRRAMRVVYEEWVGPVPADLVLDHTCRVKRCVNPKHLRPVTNWENVRQNESPPSRNTRKTHCPQGHPYDFEWRGWRDCRECRNRRKKVARQLASSR